MEKKATLFEYVYRQLVSDIEQGALRYGDALPSLHDLCDRFRVGIRTIRDVQRALKADGYIVVEERKRAVVAYRPADDADDGRIRALLARREVVADCYRTLELVMPPLFHLAARCCSDEDLFALAQDAKRVDRSGVSEGWRISHASIVCTAWWQRQATRCSRRASQAWSASVWCRWFRVSKALLPRVRSTSTGV